MGTGKDAKSPACIWPFGYPCKFTAGTKHRCANALCVAQGYASRDFLESRTNFCERSLKGTIWGFDLDTNNIKLKKSPDGDLFSAKCF